MKAWGLALGATALMLGSAVLIADVAPKLTKITKAQAAGAIFADARVQHESRLGPTSNLALLNSADRHFTAGLYKAGPGDFPIDSYPEDEFCYFLSGSVKLTSADGSVMELKAGEAVVIPKGWKGRWTTGGYSKYYAVYDPTN
jgi:uncharacterized cupin superfamily protein